MRTAASPGHAAVTIRARDVRVRCAARSARPGLLLRSGVPDPHGAHRQAHVPASRRSSVPRSCRSASTASAGAPQTVYSDHFLDTLPPEGPIGFKLEAPPVHPILAAITLPGHGPAHASFMREFANLHVQIALLRDGFHPESPAESFACATTARRCSTTR